MAGDRRNLVNTSRRFPRSMPVGILLFGQEFLVFARAMGSKEVAETCFAFLHMELVRMALGGDTASISTPELQQAGRKVEAVGFQVGQRLIERYTKDRPRFSDTLEKIKFICKDFWFEIYRKQIDKLKTNNRVRASASPRSATLLRCSPVNV